MNAHTTYLNFLPVSHADFPDWPSWEKLIAACLLGLFLLLLGWRAARRLRSPEDLQSALVPAEHPGLFGFFDLFVDGFVSFYDSVLGPHNRQHLPFAASIFLFLLAANLIGLVPGMPAITTTVWINVALAMVVFIYFNWQGVRAHGFWGYLKHFCGPFWWLAWMMFPLEVFSTCLRVLTLNLRLYWNITADHIVLGIFTDMLPPILPVVFYLLGTFVSIMQAFVFTILTLVYILLATQHEEEHE